MGGNAFNFTQTYDTARTSTCSSCKAKKDASNYWIPHLFYQAQNGSFHPVTQNGGATVYYLQRYSSNSNTLTPFPPGFRMLAGDPSLRSYNASYVFLPYSLLYLTALAVLLLNRPFLGCVSTTALLRLRHLKSQTPTALMVSAPKSSSLLAGMVSISILPTTKTTSRTQAIWTAATAQPLIQSASSPSFTKSSGTSMISLTCGGSRMARIHLFWPWATRWAMGTTEIS